jgi:hypothetical protein
MGCPTVDRICVIGRCKQVAFKNASFFTLLPSQPVSWQDMDDEARIKRHIGFAKIRMS